MIYNYHYVSAVDRQAQVVAQQALSRRLLTDTFDAAVNPLNPSGTLIFTDTPDIPVVSPNYKALYAAAATAAAQANVLAQMLGLV
jgi:hypothetical protein